MIVKQWLIDWLALRSGELKPRTVDQYRDLISRYVVPSIGAVEITQLDPDAIRSLLAAIAAAGHTRTAELVYVLLRCAFADLDPSPMLRIRRPAHRQTSPDPWTDEQMRLYTAACLVHRHGLALSLGLVLGLRRGEICGLRWSDVDLSKGCAHIRNQRVRLADGRLIDSDPKSLSSIRTVPIPAPLLSQLRAARGHPSAYICNLSPEGLGRAHRSLVRSLGLPPIPLHGLRHSMATACIRHGGDMRSLQQLLGHASYTTTANRYTHPDYEMLVTSIDAASMSCYTVIHG